MSSLRTAYAWVLLSVIVLPLFPALFVLRPIFLRLDSSGNLLRRFAARWISVYAHTTPLYRFTIEGREHLPRGRPYILVANHESGLDVLPLLLLGAPVRFLAESWMFDIPLGGWLLRTCGHISLVPGDRASGHAALEEAEQALGTGAPVAIFPEGILSPDELAPFKPGAFVLALRTHVPIVPVRLTGTGRAWRPGTVVVEGAHEIGIHVEPAVEASPGEDADALLARVRARFEASSTDARAHAAASH